MSYRLRLLILTTIGGVLLAAIGLNAYLSIRRFPGPTMNTPLADLLPLKLEGWIIKDQPIADTVEMKKAVGELLNYDDAVYRTYTQGNTSIAIYVAYWKPGKMSPRLVAGHTPDVCWVGNGWHCTERNFSYQADIPGRYVRPAQAGTYEIAGDVQHVLFWHLHQGRIVNYDIAGAPPWWAALADMRHNGLNLRGEQFFIRISSNTPIEVAIRTAPMRAAIAALGPLGLY